MWNHHPEKKAYECLCIKKDINSLMPNYRYFYLRCKFSQSDFFTWEYTKQSIKLKNNVADTSDSLFWLALYVHREPLYNTKCLMALVYYLQYNKEIYINKSS